MLQGSSHSSAESQHCPDPPSSTQQSLSEPQPQPEHSPESSPKAKHPAISIADAQCETDRLAGRTLGVADRSARLKIVASLGRLAAKGAGARVCRARAVALVALLGAGSVAVAVRGNVTRRRDLDRGGGRWDGAVADLNAAATALVLDADALARPAAAGGWHVLVLPVRTTHIQHPSVASFAGRVCLTAALFRRQRGSTGS